MKTKNIKTKVTNTANSVKQHVKDHAVDYIMAGVAIVPTLVCLKMKKENDKLIESRERRENTAYLEGMKHAYNDVSAAYHCPKDKAFLDDLLENGCGSLQYAGDDSFTKRVESAKNRGTWIPPLIWVDINQPKSEE